MANLTVGGIGSNIIGADAIGGPTFAPMTAETIASTASVGAPALGVVSNLTASGIASATSVGTPALVAREVLTNVYIGGVGANIIGADAISGQTFFSNSSAGSLTADGITSATSVGSPAITQVHALTATGVASATSVGTPAVTQAHSLIATGIASNTSVGTPSLSQAHALTASAVSAQPSGRIG